MFVDEVGQFRVGSCTFNRGIHPNIDAPSALGAQQFPNDPTGAKGAYLTWRYGDTTDNLTAAAMWAVFHYYAQDDAGTDGRCERGNAPLVPSLDMVAEASGRDDIQNAGDRARRRGRTVCREPGRSRPRSMDDGQIDGACVRWNAAGCSAPRVTLLVSGQDSPTTVRDRCSGSRRERRCPSRREP